MFIEPYLANITIFAGNFAPRSWMFCQGQLLAISQYDALFALIGTTYGGDGQTTFALPDLRGREAIHAGQGPGMNTYTLGEMSGTESVTLLSTNLPVHTHTVISLTGNPPASQNGGTLATPVNNIPATTTGINTYNSTGTSNMAATTNNAVTAQAGSSLPLGIVSPVMAMNYVIAVEGIFPSRN
jgi:microcystin-dependent protein